jgi:hypothetical protein
MKQSIQSGTFSSEHFATTAREGIPRVSLNFTATVSGETQRKMVGQESHQSFSCEPENKTQRRIS